MHLNKKILNLIFISFLICSKSFPQQDSVKKKLFITTNKDSSVLFTGHRITEKEVDTEIGKLEIGGYISTYYSHYSDEISTNGFVQFPTMAPRNNQVGLNMALISMNYLSKSVRANINLHYGDIAESVWPQPFNMIQSAHAGVKLVKGLWLDAGFFRSHIGIESTQPRENVTSSMAILSFNEPYYLSGAKLTYHINSKLSLQLDAFNSFNGFAETNKNKVIGFSALYDLNDNISITYNLLTCDETPDNHPVKHQRFYHDLYATIQLNKLSFGVEMNYGNQKNSVLKDTTKTAQMYSGLIVAKYQMIKKLATYGRAEYFSDLNNVLTETVSTGKFIYGGTFGFEYKPLKNVSLSIEGRLLESDNLIFKTKGYYLNQRSEIIGCLDIWF
jgi:hypothetical protein